MAMGELTAKMVVSCDNCWRGGLGVSDFSSCPHGCFTGRLWEVHRNMPQQHVKPLGALSYEILETFWRAVPEGSCCRLIRWEERCLVSDQRDTRHDQRVNSLLLSPLPTPYPQFDTSLTQRSESECKKLPQNVLFDKMNKL